jgi:hypothetical protein
MDSGLPGIASLRFFSKFRFGHNWRIREKVAEIFILAVEEETVRQSLNEDIERAFALAIAKFGCRGSLFPKPERCLRKKVSSYDQMFAISCERDNHVASDIDLVEFKHELLTKLVSNSIRPRLNGVILEQKADSSRSTVLLVM